MKQFKVQLEKWNKGCDISVKKPPFVRTLANNFTFEASFTRFLTASENTYNPMLMVTRSAVGECHQILSTASPRYIYCCRVHTQFLLQNYGMWYKCKKTLYMQSISVVQISSVDIKANCCTSYLNRVYWNIMSSNFVLKVCEYYPLHIIGLIIIIVWFPVVPVE